MKQPQAKRRKSAGCLALVLALVAIAIIQGPVSAAIDTLFNPWAHSWRGEPALVGKWVGSAMLPSGKPIGLLLDIQRSRTSRGRYSTCRNCPRIEGTAKQCGAGDQGYEIWGGPDTWSGAQFHLNKRPVEPEVAKLQLGYMRGEWAGDTLRVSMTLESKTNQADDPRDVARPVEITLQPGDEASFQAACGK